MTVAAIGFVNAGLLSFQSSLWVVFGSNVGSTVTGWLVAWIGFKIKIDLMALPFIGIGMALKLVGEGNRRGGLGAAMAGFGLLFLGIDLLKDGFSGLGPDTLPPLGSDAISVLIAVGIGIVATVVLQASAATLTLTLTAVAGGMLTLEAGAGIVIGANLGTTITGIMAAIAATPNARRLAAAHVFFNLVTTVVALALLGPLLWVVGSAAEGLTGNGDPVNQLVLFHTVFNIVGVALMWPLSDVLIRFLRSKFRSADDDLGQPRHLDRNVAAVPALALRALRRELARMGHLAMQLSEQALRLQSQEPVDGIPLNPDKARRQLSRSLEAIEHLLKEIGIFISDMSQRPMHPDVSGQLPELLRIATHFDTVARLMHQLGMQPIDPASRSSQSTEVLSQAIIFFQMADPLNSDKRQGWLTQTQTAHQSFEDHYRSGKTALLESGSRGQIAMQALYETLAKMSDLRRATDQTMKAAQRIDQLPIPAIAR
jgi:phosphate:Na+ symporter